MKMTTHRAVQIHNLLDSLESKGRILIHAIASANQHGFYDYADESQRKLERIILLKFKVRNRLNRGETI